MLLGPYTASITATMTTLFTGTRVAKERGWLTYTRWIMLCNYVDALWWSLIRNTKVPMLCILSYRFIHIPVPQTSVCIFCNLFLSWYLQFSYNSLLYLVMDNRFIPASLSRKRLDMTQPEMQPGKCSSKNTQSPHGKVSPEIPPTLE